MAGLGTSVDNIISIRDLHMRFGTHVIYDGLDLDVKKGEILGIVGGSGQGKSVMMRCITGILTPASGIIAVFGQDISRLSKNQRKKLDAHWGILFQDGALFSALTVMQNIVLPMKIHLSLPDRLMEELAMLRLKMVGLPLEAMNKYPSELSGGMRKRVGLARALSLDPDLLFLDEPTAGLDPIGAASFDNLILRLQKTLGLTVYMVTHDQDTIFKTCDRVAVLADKKIVRTGSPSELHENPGHPWIEDYFCGERARAAVDNLARSKVL